MWTPYPPTSDPHRGSDKPPTEPGEPPLSHLRHRPLPNLASHLSQMDAPPDLARSDFRPPCYRPVRASKPRRPSEAEVYTDPQGNRIVRVGVAPGLFAEADEADWLRVRRDFGEQWGLSSATGRSSHRYVVVLRERGRDGTVAVARAILCAEARQHVTYRDGNQLNLRRSNLFIRRGASRHAVPLGGYTKPMEWTSLLEISFDEGRRAQVMTSRFVPSPTARLRD